MDYTTHLKTLYGLSADSRSGLSAAEIARIEAQAGGVLPQALKHYLSELGGNADINQSFNRLLAATDGMRWSSDGRLVFCEEHQQAAVWGIRREHLDREDPPVCVCYDASESGEWLPESETLSGFLWKTALFNGTMGGLGFVANYVRDTPLPPAVLQRIAENRQRLNILCDAGADYYTRGGADVVIACKNPSSKITGLFVGTQDQACFDKLLDIFDSDDDWSYTSYDDWDDDDGEE